MAVCKHDIIGMKFKQGGYDNFSYKIFIEETIKEAKLKYNLDNKRIIIYHDNCSAHMTPYVINSLSKYRITF